MNAKNALYICYDGLLQPLGQSQVLNLLLSLRSQGSYSFSIVSFESTSDLNNERYRLTREKLQAAGIYWLPLTFRRRPFGVATLWNALKGFFLCLSLVKQKRITLIHARSYVPAGIAFAIKCLLGTPYIFDMRGFWVDERVDIGSMRRSGLAYKILKRVENRLLLSADTIISLSQAGIEEMRQWRFWKKRESRVTMIPTCTNLELFRLNSEARPAGFRVGHIGSANSWYRLDPFFASFLLIQKKIPSAKLVLINRHDQKYLLSLVKKYGISEQNVELKDIEHHQMAEEINRLDAAIFFIHPSYSKIASSPTKLGELLACGVPCLTNTGVGDVDKILAEDRVGITVPKWDASNLERGVEELLALAQEPGLRERCAATAQKHYSLETGTREYGRIYEEIFSR